MSAASRRSATSVTEPGPTDAPMHGPDHLALYRRMLLIRRFEEKCVELYSARAHPRIPAPLHR